MNITLGNARTFLAPWVKAGINPTSDTVRDAINEAILRLLPKALWDGTQARLRFRLRRSTITMPREVETVLSANYIDAPITMHNSWFEFLSVGPGTLEETSSGWTSLVDLGDGFCIHTDMNKSHQILVTSTSVENNASILLRGLDDAGREVMTAGVMGEQIVIDHLMPRYSVNKFSQITGVVKPRTKGYVGLSAYDPAPLARYDIALYHPEETNPHYRRYFIASLPKHYEPSVHHPVDSGCTRVSGHGEHECRTLTVKVKLRALPALDDSDTLLIQNLPALKSELQAIRAFDAGDFQKGTAYEMMAVNLLNEQLTSKEVVENSINIEDGFGAGSIRNIR